jgi:tRNA U34 5-carboxymethylaminomethyl modifying enzyme MnmG/GidA
MITTTKARVEVNSVTYSILQKAAKDSNLKVNSFLNAWVYSNRDSLAPNFLTQVNQPSSERINNALDHQVSMPEEVNLGQQLAAN